MKDREQILGVGVKSLRGLTAAGFLFLTGCIPTESQIKKVDLGEIEITQISPHSYRVYTQITWNWQRKPALDRAMAFLSERCVIEHIERSELVVVENPNCVEELR